MLEAFGENLWIATCPLRFLGLEVGARMTVIRLEDGGLFVHSPIPLEPAMREAVDALGPVRAIVAPNLYHHLYAGDWALAYPNASVSACPGLEQKRKDVRWSRVLGDAPLEECGGDIEQVFVGALPMFNEVVFFHRKSKTLVTSDLVFNLASHPSPLTRAAAFLLGNRKPGPTFLERLMMKDRAAGRAQLDRILGWGAERVVLAHGDVLAANGTAVVRDGYRWLTAS